ncbi:hypothetical protein A1O3_10498 [Capronia epimyces CBS 606.96]|uniref:Uncharacterized protein n=1 Tax=Capronia epimyces CBS 606.96 TaxID=1182542 RepID=W9X9H5_9EURO|nr:uncharacterized protein A1O3_10498 [Capronia epimyces CBS 606.96]EXJ76853.1 hypothetical protein A1O3_10498 [Capronia epimyces CBS 606.96]
MAERESPPSFTPLPPAAEDREAEDQSDASVKMDIESHPTPGRDLHGGAVSEEQPAGAPTTSSLQEQHIGHNSSPETVSTGFAVDLDDGVSPETTPAADARSQALRSKWNQLSTLADSFIGNLITTGDSRRDALDKRRVALENISSFLKCSQDHTHPPLLELEKSLLVLQDREQKLYKMDETLIGQGDELQTQASKIFGPVANVSFEILDQQGVVVQSSEDDTDESTFMEDDIRLDKTSEAQHYLSKKGDVDLLRESLMELEVERVLIAEDQTLEEEDPGLLDSLESREQELRQQLKLAENDLDQLHDKLPERKVDIPEDQLRPLDERTEPVSDLSLSTRGSVHQEGQETQEPASRPRDSLLQILESVTDENPVRANTLVNAYLYYQLKSSPEEQLAFSRAVQDAVQDGDQPVETDPQCISLDHWFTEEAKSKPSKSRVRGIFSQDSNASHLDYSHLTHGQSEPHMLPAQFLTSDNVRRLDQFLRNKAADEYPNSTR